MSCYRSNTEARNKFYNCIDLQENGDTGSWQKLSKLVIFWPCFGIRAYILGRRTEKHEIKIRVITN